MGEKWYILAGTLLWSVVLILIALILIRLLKQYRMEQRIEDMEEAEARRVATRFAAVESSHQESMDSVDSLDLEFPLNRPAVRQTRFGRGGGRNRPHDLPGQPNRVAIGDERFSVYHGLTPDELRTHCPVVIHEAPKGGEKDIAEGQLSEDGQLVCAVCLDDVAFGQRKRVLPCSHAFHAR